MQELHRGKGTVHSVATASSSSHIDVGFLPFRVCLCSLTILFYISISRRGLDRHRTAGSISGSASPSQEHSFSFNQRPRRRSYQSALSSPHVAHKEVPPERLGRTCPSTPAEGLISLPLVPEPSDQADSTSNLMIRQELHSNTNLSLDRINVLESALALVRKFVATSERADTVSHEPGIGCNLPVPQDVTMELFYMMFSGMSGIAIDPLYHVNSPRPGWWWAGQLESLA